MKKKSNAKYPHVLSVKISDRDRKRLLKLAAHASAGAVCRLALNIGLDAVEAQPAILAGETPRGS